MPVLTLDSGSQALFQPQPGGGSVTMINLSDTVTVYVATTTTVHSTDIPVGPGASVTFDARQWWYGSALTTTAQVAVGAGVTGYFLPASLANIGGSKVYVQAGAPAGTIPVHSIWFNTTLSSLETWDGSAWVTEQFDASQLIQAATILGNQIASQAVTAANVADGTLTTAQLAAAAGILGSQIASATITSGNIAANTIVAANIAANTITASQIAAGAIGTGQLAANAVTAAKIAAGTITATQIAANTITAAKIAANTITAAQLAAGIVYAGIVDSTTITSATINASTFNGTNWTENSSGSFLYNGTPAAGNLIVSMAPAAGTDAHGNTYPQGLAVNGTTGGTVTIDPSGNSGIAYIFLKANGATHIVNPPQIIAGVVNPGAANEVEDLVLFSGQGAAGNNNASLQLFGAAADASIPAAAIFDIGGVTTQLGGGIGGYLPVTQANISYQTRTNATTFTNILPATWGIPAGDPVQGTVYRLSTFGTGVWEGNTLTFHINAFGQAFATLPVGAALGWTTGTSFVFDLVATVIVSQTGASGLLSGSIRLNMAQTGNNELPTTGINASGGFAGVGQASVANPGSAAANMTVQHEWGASNASQSLTTNGSTFERLSNS